MTNPKVICATCFFLDALGKDQICRRNPPAPNVVVDKQKAKSITAWPVVIPDRDWCGQHAPHQMVKVK